MLYTAKQLILAGKLKRKNKEILAMAKSNKLKKQGKFDDVRIAHMNMVQGVITRMASNSFSLKVLAMTLASAVLALIGSIEKPNIVFPIAAIFPILVFWLMDAEYLRLERLFRKLFDDIREGKVEPFVMNPHPYKNHIQSVFRIAFSWSVVWIYLAILSVLVIVSIVIKTQL